MDENLGVSCSKMTVSRRRLGEDRQWETSTSYPSVAYDPAAPAAHRYRLWYATLIFDNKYHQGTHANTSALFPHGRRQFGTAFAQSADGLRWEKPALNLVTFLNSTANNLICVGCSGVGIISRPGGTAILLMSPSPL